MAFRNQASPRRDDLAQLFGASVETLLVRCEFDPLSDHVLASGSIIEGFGNTGSDVDVFVISMRKTRDPTVVFSPELKRFVDIAYLRAQMLVDLSSRIPGVTKPPQDWVSRPCAAFEDVDLYHRLAIAVALTDPVSGNLLNFSREKLGQEIAFQSIVASRARWLDAAGAFQDQQFDQSWYAGRFAYEHSLDAYAAILGETNPSPKWRWARLRRIADSERDVLKAFEAFEAATLSPHADPCTRAADMLSRAANTLAHAQSLMLSGCPLPDQWTSDNPCERIEPTTSGVYLLKSDGLAELVSASVPSPLGPVSA